MTRPMLTETPVARIGDVEVSKFETATGPRLRLRRSGRKQSEAYLDPLELEGLTRVRHKPIAILRGPSRKLDEEPGRTAVESQRLQNEFALVAVGGTAANGETVLLITDMNAGLSVLLTAAELEALLTARHMDFAPLIDTSDLVAIPEPDIDQA